MLIFGDARFFALEGVVHYFALFQFSDVGELYFDELDVLELDVDVLDVDIKIPNAWREIIPDSSKC